MNIYIETNFVLELVFEQEQRDACQAILELCASGRANLILPAYCLTEPLETLGRRKIGRDDLRESLERERDQLTRTASYNTWEEGIRAIESLLLRSAEEERQRFAECRDRLLAISQIIPLNTGILTRAVSCEREYELTPQDALVFASVITHLDTYQATESCFLNKNFKDFKTPEIITKLRGYNCKILFNFEDGLAFLQAKIPAI